ncbi:hypothetical protein [Streptomyces sp. NPDC102476]|uniref:hypothetical protein n=1 Tax=Streptomyces sp. NPDC102476 TaxID=3366181 RepID=UPI0038188850
MQLPAEAVTATVLIEVVRISALPTRRDVPYPGTAVAHWAGSEAAAALTLIESLPGSEQHRCGFSPGWSVRAYDDSLDLALFEAAFCFTCHEVRMHGTAVPPALATQFPTGSRTIRMTDANRPILRHLLLIDDVFAAFAGGGAAPGLARTAVTDRPCTSDGQLREGRA